MICTFSLKTNVTTCSGNFIFSGVASADHLKRVARLEVAGVSVACLEGKKVSFCASTVEVRHHKVLVQLSPPLCL